VWFAFSRQRKIVVPDSLFRGGRVGVPELAVPTTVLQAQVLWGVVKVDKKPWQLEVKHIHSCPIGMGRQNVQYWSSMSLAGQEDKKYMYM